MIEIFAIALFAWATAIYIDMRFNGSPALDVGYVRPPFPLPEVGWCCAAGACAVALWGV